MHKRYQLEIERKALAEEQEALLASADGREFLNVRQQEEDNRLSLEILAIDRELEQYTGSDDGKTHGNYGSFSTSVGLPPHEGDNTFQGPSPSRRENNYRALFGEPAKTDWGSAEEFYKAVGSGLGDSRLMAVDPMRIESDPYGGFSVPQALSASLLDGAMAESQILDRITTVPMTSNTQSYWAFDASSAEAGSLFGGFSPEWIDDETSTMTLQTGVVKKLVITAYKLGVFAQASNEILADGISFERQLTDALTGSISWALEDSVLNGNGVGQSLGILNSGSAVTVAEESAQTDSTIVYQNLAKMYSRLHGGLHRGATWIVSPTCIPQLLQMSIAVGDAGSHYPVLSESGDGRMRMLGIDVLVCDKSPELGATGDVILCNLREYLLGLRAEVRLDKSAHLGFQEDISSFRCIVRACGVPRWTSSFTPKSGTAGSTTSWAVILGERVT